MVHKPNYIVARSIPEQTTINSAVVEVDIGTGIFMRFAIDRKRRDQLRRRSKSDRTNWRVIKEYLTCTTRAFKHPDLNDIRSDSLETLINGHVFNTARLRAAQGIARARNEHLKKRERQHRFPFMDTP